MSVMMKVKGGETVNVKLACYECGHRDDGKPQPNCPNCYGSGIEILEEPKYFCSFSNVSFREFVHMMDLPLMTEDIGYGDVIMGGVLEGKVLDEACRKAIRLLNDPAEVKRYVSETTISGGPGTGKCTWIDCGRDYDYWIKKLHNFLDVCHEARELGKGIDFG